MKRLPMQVPESFRKAVRKKSGEKDISMFKYLDALAEEINDVGKDDKKRKKFGFKW